MPPARNIPPGRGQPPGPDIFYKPCSSVRRNVDITQRPASPNKHRVPSHNSQHLMSLLDSPHRMDQSSVRLGIAIYNRPVPGLKPGANKVTHLWCLVSHPTSLENLDDPAVKRVGIHKVTLRDPDGPREEAEAEMNPDNYTWKVRDTADSLFDDELNDCLGIISIADIPWSPDLMNSVLDSFKDGNKSNDDPGDFSSWSSAAWVVRVLAHLEGLLLTSSHKDFLKSPPVNEARVNVNAHAPPQVEYNNPLNLKISVKLLHKLVTKRMEELKDKNNKNKKHGGEVHVIDLHPTHSKSASSSSSSASGASSSTSRRESSMSTFGSPSRSGSKPERTKAKAGRG